MNDQSKLGEGGYAVVYKCSEIISKRPYAVKIVDRKKLSGDEDKGIQKEVDIMKRLNHPHVVSCLDFFVEPARYMVVMNVVEGGELFDRIVKKSTRTGSYNELETREIMKIMFTAIKYLHDNRIVHRDLKPENLLLMSQNDDSSLKIADFGFATYTDGEDLTEGVGTAGYVAPEILLGKAYGKAVDMWSLGVISFIIVGGYPPFHEPSEAKNNQNIVKGRFSFADSHWGHISQDLKDLIRGLMTVNPKKRLTVDQVLSHPWMQESDENLSRVSMDINLKQLRSFNAKRKFRACVKTIVATHRFTSILEKLRTLKTNPSQQEVGKTVNPLLEK